MSEHVLLDSILSETDEFGKYQKRITVLISIAAAMIYFSSVMFIFETKSVNHRCKVSGCDTDSVEFMPPWLINATSAVNSQIYNCMNFERTINTGNQNCDINELNQQIEVQCKEFIYETSEITIIQDYNLHCKENMWKLTLVGTIHYCGVFVGLPITGILSDKFGRKTYLIYGMTLSGIMGLLRSFANSYMMFIILEFLDACCISGAFATVWILGIEYVGPKKRVFVTVVIGAFFSSGGVVQALIAWKIKSWRILLQVLYSFQLFMVLYQWLIPESTRWLLSKEKITEAKLILENIAQVNKRIIHGNTLKELEEYEISKERSKHPSVMKLFHSKILILRFINCAMCWVCCVFLYYGFTVNSVQLSQNSYLDVILTILVEIPGNLVYAIIDKVGRRISLILGFLLTGLSCFITMLIPKYYYWWQLVLYLLGKLSVSFSIGVLYTVTTEIFPTPFRNTLLSTCSMIGAFGAICAPQIPLLRMYWNDLPLILFEIASIMATISALLLPETMNTELPTTVEEAEDIGKTHKRKVVIVL
ncbi:hypothetical protein FQR65_LT08209 [Abscondita terminalis]|nr:hypothetical protein FQR65_LT08209 [Abscondita terminalis]